MKIIFPLGAFYPSQMGGPCNTLYWHTCALKSKDIDNFVITTNRGIANEKIDTNKWILNECGNVYYSKRGLVSFCKFILQLSKMLHKSDVIHLNSLFNFYSIFSFTYCKLFLRNKSIVWSVRGELNKNALKFNNWKKIPFLWLYKRLNKNITYHSTSEEETIHIQEFFLNAQIVQIPNLLSPADRIETNVSNYLLFVGRIHKIKAIHKLIEALSLSEKFKKSNFELHIIGKHEERHDSYKLELVNLINNLGLEHKIFFKGHLEGEQKELAYANAYALVLPSETENFGNVVVEALNQGTPVIASHGTPWKVLEEFQCGLHVSNVPEDLSISIDRVISLTKDKYYEWRKNATKLVDQKFNIKTQIHNWVSIYNSIYNKNGK